MTFPSGNAIQGALAKLLGVSITTIIAALALKMFDPTTMFGRWLMLIVAVANAYGYYGAVTYQTPRMPWTEEQRRAESARRIASGQAPLAGHEDMLQPKVIAAVLKADGSVAPAPAATATTETTTTLTAALPPPTKGP